MLIQLPEVEEYLSVVRSSQSGEMGVVSIKGENTIIVVLEGVK